MKESSANVEVNGRHPRVTLFPRSQHAHTQVAANGAMAPLVKECCRKQQWGRLSDLLAWMHTQVRTARLWEISNVIDRVKHEIRTRFDSELALRTDLAWESTTSSGYLYMYDLLVL